MKKNGLTKMNCLTKTTVTMMKKTIQMTTMRMTAMKMTTKRMNDCAMTNYLTKMSDSTSWNRWSLSCSNLTRMSC